jgi:hypothetical protein
MSRKRRQKRPLPGAGAIPAIFVKVRSPRGYLGYEFKRAAIQIRRSKYRYLVWYEERQKHEFYLGQVRALPLRRSTADVAIASSSADAGGIRAGAGK